MKSAAHGSNRQYVAKLLLVSAVSKCVDLKVFIEPICPLLRSSVPLRHDMCINDTRLKKYRNKNLCC